MPLVSVVIPIFRYDWELSAAIESVLRQSFTGFEIVIIDNNATPAARAVAEQYKSEHPGKVRLVREVMQGNGSARNRGVREAGGSLIAFLDSDDLMAPSRLARQTQALEDNSAAILTHSAVARCSYDGSSIVERHRRPRIPSWAEILEIPFCDPDLTSVMCRKDAALETGLFDEQLNPFWLEDTDFSFQMFAHGLFLYIDEPLTIMRCHPEGELLWREQHAYDWHSLSNATRFFQKVRDAHYDAGEPGSRRRFRRARADWLRGSAKALFRSAEGAQYGRLMLAATLHADPIDWRNWKQYFRSRLPYPLCARLLKVDRAEAPIPQWIDRAFIESAFSLAPNLE